MTECRNCKRLKSKVDRLQQGIDGWTTRYSEWMMKNWQSKLDPPFVSIEEWRDRAGILQQDLKDAAALLKKISNYDSHDPSSMIEEIQEAARERSRAIMARLSG